MILGATFSKDGCKQSPFGNIPLLHFELFVAHKTLDRVFIILYPDEALCADFVITWELDRRSQWVVNTQIHLTFGALVNVHFKSNLHSGSDCVHACAGRTPLEEERTREVNISANEQNARLAGTRYHARTPMSERSGF